MNVYLIIAEDPALRQSFRDFAKMFQVWDRASRRSPLLYLLRRSHSIMKTLITLSTLLLLVALPVTAQSTGTVRGTLINGTTGEPGRAETVTLYDLSAGMEAVALVERAHPVPCRTMEGKERAAQVVTRHRCVRRPVAAPRVVIASGRSCVRC